MPRNISLLYIGLLLPGLLLTVGSARAGDVWWDVSHQPLEDYHPGGAYQQLASELEQQGFTVMTGEEPIDPDVLWDVDILVCSVLSGYEEAYNQAEVERIASFVDGGGGLIILADNSEIQPENLEALLDEFGLSAAGNDDIDALTDFDDLSIFEEVARVEFDIGGAVAADEDEGGQVVAFDEAGHAGIAVNQSRPGAVILIGDADVWTNQIIGQADNSRLALNCFTAVDRECSGRILTPAEGVEIHLPEGRTWTQNVTVLNRGEGLLEIGCCTDEGSGFLDCTPRLAVIEPDGSIELEVILCAEDLQADTCVSGTVVIRHNDPTSQPIELEYTLHIVPGSPVHFNVPPPSGIDHSLLVRELTIEGKEAPPGVEVGVFTPDDLCAGGAVYCRGQLGIPTRADNPLTEEVEGFLSGEPFTFRLYLPWSGSELGALPVFERGPTRFTADALTTLSLDSRPEAAFTLRLNRRWNWISLNLQPAELTFSTILAPLLDENLLILIKDGTGRFWNVQQGFNNLGENWDLTRGYQVLVTQPTSLEVRGTEVDPGRPIRLRPGWSLVPFLPREAQPLEESLASLEGSLQIVKRDDGAFWYPEWGWNGIGALVPGEGYKLRLTRVDTLIYPADVRQVRTLVEREPFNTPPPTDRDMSLLLLGMPPESQVRVFSDDGHLVGTGRPDHRGRIGLPVRGDDPDTPGLEGLREGEPLTLQVSENGRRFEPAIRWLEGTGQYSTDGIAVGRTGEVWMQPYSTDIICRPNPFNDRLRVGYRNECGSAASIRIYDLAGRLVAESALPASDNRRTSGAGVFTLNTLDWPAGVLVVKLSVGEEARTVKVVHLP